MSVKPFYFFLPLLFTLPSHANNPLPGHLQPLGSQVVPVGDVLTLAQVPSPEEFFNEFVKPGKPVLFKGAAIPTPAFKSWTDDYLSSKFGKVKFDVEEGKKENRSKELFNMPLEEFLKSYKEKDIYLVASVPKIMRGDIYLLKCILCGGFTDELQDTVMWFSNGGTKSVLHFDAIDNINCLMSGTKELFMVDKKEHAHINIDKPDGSFSKVDVDKVDLEKYPGLADVPWYKATMEPGDCLFIPYRWFHQVRSYGPRNLAINIWFTHRLTFKPDNCEKSAYKDKEFAPLSEFQVKEITEPGLSLLLIDEMGEQPIDEKKFFEIIEKLWPSKKWMNEAAIETLKAMFEVIDANKDTLITQEEVRNAQLEEYEEDLMEILPQDEEGDESVHDEDDVRPGDDDDKYENLGRRGDL